MAPAAVSHLSAAPVEVRGSWRAAYDERKEEYIRSIDITDVYALASLYHYGQPCVEFRPPKRGNYNICYFVEFPSDGEKWVVRFPLAPVLYDVQRKLQCEIATMEYVASKTTIPVSHVRAYGLEGSSESSNPTGKCFIIIDYIDGLPLNKSALFETTEANQDRFYASLADFYSQMRGLEFDAAGALTLDTDGAFRLTDPLSMDINALDLRERNVSMHLPSTTALDNYARQLYSILLARAADPVSEMGLLDVQYLVFALQDFQKRMYEFTSSIKGNKFVLSHGALRPSNIILGEDFSIKGIIDWEWAGTVPSSFFVPPLWLGKNIAPVPNDISFKDCFTKLRMALMASGSRLALEWTEDLHSGPDYYIPAALLNQHFFMTLYFTHLFPFYFKDEKRHIKIRHFFERDGPDGVHSRQVDGLMRAGRGMDLI